VCPAADAVDRILGPRLADDLYPLLPGQLGAIRFAQLESVEHGGRVLRDSSGDPRVLGLELRDQHVYAGEGPAELLDVLGVHAVEPGVLVEPRAPQRRDADDAVRAYHPLGQQGRAGERVWPAPRPAGAAELPETGAARRADAAAALAAAPTPGGAGRPAVPGPVVRDHEDAEPPIKILVRPPFEPAAGRSVQDQDREAVGVAPQRERELASVRRLESQERLAQGAEHTLSVDARGHLRGTRRGALR